MKTQIAICGAGAIGLTLAYELARRGRDVTVIDRDRLHRNGSPDGDPRTASEAPFRSASTWAAAGILPPANAERSTDPIDRLRGISHQLFPDLCRSLTEQTGIDPGLIRCGAWYLSDSAGETASMMGMVSYWNDLSIQCVEVEAGELVRREPGLAGWAGAMAKPRAWWVPDECQIATPRYLQSLVAACRSLGVTFCDHSRVLDFQETESGVSLSVESLGESGDAGDASAASPRSTSVFARRPSRRVEAEQLAICGGAWTGLISAKLRLANSLVPVRGQILMLKSNEPLLQSIVNLGHRYLVPRPDGAVLVGSCEEEVGLQHGTTPVILEDLRQFARKMCPPLAAAREIHAWSGMRPMTFDGFPMIGKLPDSRAIFVAAGHFRSGVHLSPGTASCLADVMTGCEPPMDLEPFRVGKQQSH